MEHISKFIKDIDTATKYTDIINLYKLMNKLYIKQLIPSILFICPRKCETLERYYSSESLKNPGGIGDR